MVIDLFCFRRNSKSESKSKGIQSEFLKLFNQNEIQPVSQNPSLLKKSVMVKYYLLTWKNGGKQIASAFAPIGTKLAQDLIIELNGVNRLPFIMELMNLSESKNEIIKSNNLQGLNEVWQDYQANSLVWPIMSEKLKSLIEANLLGSENIDWIECLIKNGSEERPYFILRFNKMLDVLDKEKTMFIQGTDHIIRPVFASLKICEYSVFF